MSNPEIKPSNPVEGGNLKTETGEIEIPKQPTKEEIEISKQKNAEEINGVAESIDATKTQIKETREKLGIPHTEENPPSVVEDQKRLEKLQTEKGNLEKQEAGKQEGEKGKETAEKFVEMKHFEPMLESLKKLYLAFNEREGAKLNPLIDRDSIQLIRGVGTQFESLFSRKNVKQEEVAQIVGKTIQIIERIGNAPRQQMVRDNPESLSNVMFSLKRLGETSIDITRSGKYQGLNKSLARLVETSQQRWLGIVKLREALQRY